MPIRQRRLLAALTTVLLATAFPWVHADELSVDDIGFRLQSNPSVGAEDLGTTNDGLDFCLFQGLTPGAAVIEAFAAVSGEREDSTVTWKAVAHMRGGADAVKALPPESLPVGEPFAFEPPARAQWIEVKAWPGKRSQAQKRKALIVSGVTLEVKPITVRERRKLRGGFRVTVRNWSLPEELNQPLVWITAGSTTSAARTGEAFERLEPCSEPGSASIGGARSYTADLAVKELRPRDRTTATVWVYASTKSEPTLDEVVAWQDETAYHIPGAWDLLALIPAVCGVGLAVLVPLLVWRLRVEARRRKAAAAGEGDESRAPAASGNCPICLQPAAADGRCTWGHRMSCPKCKEPPGDAWFCQKCGASLVDEGTRSRHVFD